MFDETQAAEILDFIKAIDPDKDSLLIHCHAGISRSSAVGYFIMDYFNLNYDKFCRDNPYICPSQHILKTLRKVNELV